LLKHNLYIANNFADEGHHLDPPLDHPAEISPIIGLAHSYALKVVENSAQALGSIYPGGNTASFGAGGMVVKNDAALTRRVRILRTPHWEKKSIPVVAVLRLLPQVIGMSEM